MTAAIDFQDGAAESGKEPTSNEVTGWHVRNRIIHMLVYSSYKMLQQQERKTKTEELMAGNKSLH